MGLARQWVNLSSTGLSNSVVETIQCARASSTRTLYGLKWRVFESWCSKYQAIPFQCSVAVILSFLQDLIEKGKSFSTIKVYLAAISACHVGFDGKTVGQHPLVCQFMKGARRKLHVPRSLTPSWDLPSVLDALSGPPFEPLDQVDLKMLSLKVALLLALASAKRISEIHALSVHQACIRFSPGGERVSLRPNPAFIPKVIGSLSPIELVAFYPPPHSSEEQRRLHALCPVRALRAYLYRTQDLRRSDQLFVSWAKPHVGRPVSKQRLSHWIVEAIALAYAAKGLQPPAGLHAHSTRGMATSWALFKGVSAEEVCAAASWASPNTFAKFYRLDVTAPVLAHSVLGVGPSQDITSPL